MLPSADTVPGVTALYAPHAPQIVAPGFPAHPCKTLVGTLWEQGTGKITLQKPGEIPLGFVLPGNEAWEELRSLIEVVISRLSRAHDTGYESPAYD